MNSLELKRRKQDEQTLHQLEEIEKFTNQAETELLSFVKCINQQKLEIKKDSEKIQSSIEALLSLWKANVVRMKKSLKDTVVEVRDLIMLIKDYSSEDSPLMDVIMKETTLDRLYDDLVKMESNTNAAKIQSVFKHLIKVNLLKYETIDFKRKFWAGSEPKVQLSKS
jgi:superfamily I DNA/RNA helicase